MQDFGFGVEIHKFLLVFCRVAGSIRFLPALGEAFFPLRIKVAFSLALSAVIYPLAQSIFSISEQPILLLSHIIKETFIGAFLGLTVRLTFASLHTASIFIATESGLAFASMYDPTQREQSTVVTALITTMVLAAIFLTDTHHLFIKLIIHSYEVFNPNMALNIADFSASITNTISYSLQIALKIAAPFLVISLIITICNGILSRLMPSFQVFFVMTPLQVLITYLLLLLTMNSTINLSLAALESAILNIK